MIYLDTQTQNVTTDEDVAIAMTGEPGVTVEVGLALVNLVNAGVLAPMWEAA